MKRSTKIISAVLVSVGLVSAGATAFAKNHWGNAEKRADFMVSHITGELDLDPTQTQALDVLKDQMLSARKLVKRDQIKAETIEILNADSFDRARALALITAKTAAVNEQAPDMVNAFGDFFDTLDSKQKSELSEMMQKHRSKGRRKYR